MSLFNADLGTGRAWERVGDSYEVTRKPRGLDLSSFDAIPFAPMEAIPQGGAYAPALTMKAPRAITSGTYFERGDILVSKITPSFENGKQALIRDLPLPFGYATTEVIPLRSRDKTHDPRLLFFYLLHPDVRHYVAERMEGSTGRQRVPDSVLLDLPLPRLDPLDQTAVADALELVQRASAAEFEAMRVSQELKRSAMRALFTRGLRGAPPTPTEFGYAPDTWQTIPLADCAAVQTGVAKGRKLDDADTVSVPYLRVANVQDGHLDLTEMKEIQVRRSEIGRYRLREGDVVLTEGGDFDKLGRGFIWRGELDLCVHQNHVFAVRPDRSRLLPEFFAYLAQSAYGKAYFLKVAHKTTNLACINSTKLKAFPVLIPPTLGEQQEIVATLDALDRKIRLHHRKRVVLGGLFQSLLHKLMTGEIRVEQLDLSTLSAATSQEPGA